VVVRGDELSLIEAAAQQSGNQPSWEEKVCPQKRSRLRNGKKLMSGCQQDSCSRGRGGRAGISGCWAESCRGFVTLCVAGM